MTSAARWHGCLLSSVFACAAACAPGKTHILGRVPDSDAGDDDDSRTDEESGARDAAARDASADGQADESDAAFVSCQSQDDCTTRARPFCSEALGQCVECKYDRHCDSDEYCRDRTGTCVHDRN